MGYVFKNFESPICPLLMVKVYSVETLPTRD